MEQSAFDGLVQRHVNEGGQDSGWAISIVAADGTVVDVFVLHQRDIGAEGDVAAIRRTLARHYGVEDLELTPDNTIDDDGVAHPVFLIEGLRRK